MPVKASTVFCKESNSPLLGADVETPIGQFTIRVCDHGIHSITTKELIATPPQHFYPDPHRAVNFVLVRESEMEMPTIMMEAAVWLSNYFKDSNALTMKIPDMCFPSNESTEFERQVWEVLTVASTFGHTFTYAELAARIGNPKASRAVGTALSKNPIILIVPCHRVVRSDGKVGNYSAGGSTVKEWLLNYEKTALHNFVYPKEPQQIQMRQIKELEWN